MLEKKPLNKETEKERARLGLEENCPISSNRSPCLMTNLNYVSKYKHICEIRTNDMRSIKHEPCGSRNYVRYGMYLH